MVVPLLVNRNIMPLPKKEGLHPTMNTHPGGAHTDGYKTKMSDALSDIIDSFKNEVITKDQLELEFWM